MGGKNQHEDCSPIDMRVFYYFIYYLFLGEAKLAPDPVS